MQLGCRRSAVVAVLQGTAHGSVRVCDSRPIHMRTARACVACVWRARVRAWRACVPTQVFAGRFDMRTMLAALYPIPPEVPPYFDHSQHDELW